MDEISWKLCSHYHITFKTAANECLRLQHFFISAKLSNSHSLNFSNSRFLSPENGYKNQRTDVLLSNSQTLILSNSGFSQTLNICTESS